MPYETIWFFLWGILWAVYFVADGFDLGVGILHNFLAQNDTEKRVIIRTIGPVWDGNEVWLVTAGGATFAAFPAAYAIMFSYLYTPMLLILFALIIRGVAVEFRGKENSERWKTGWDTAIFAGSFLVALLFGVAFGNIFQGIPMDASGYRGAFWSLLNPYGLLSGVLFVMMFVIHGSLWIAVKSEGDLSKRAAFFCSVSWIALMIVTLTFLIQTALTTKLWNNYLQLPALFIIPFMAVASLAGIKYFINAGRPLAGFLSSCAFIFTVILTGIAGLYPNLLPSSIDPAFSVTVFNAASSPYTLKIMTFVALIFVPVVIAYQLWVYRVFRHKVTGDDVAEDGTAY